MLFFLVPTQVRLGMTNPPYMLAQLPQIAAALKHPNVFAFLHVPVQSGSDPVRCELTYLFFGVECCGRFVKYSEVSFVLFCEL